MIITISGTPGSGKSTVADLVAKKLHYQRFSTGQYMREMAQKKGVTLLELSKHAELDASIDKELDNWQKKLGKQHDNFILDARLGFHFIPNSFKVFLKVSDKEAAKRIFFHKHPNRKNEKENTNINSTYHNIIRRRQSENKRYKSLYNINYEDKSNYNLVIDTTRMLPNKVAEKIIKAFEDYKNEYERKNTI